MSPAPRRSCLLLEGTACFCSFCYSSKPGIQRCQIKCPGIVLNEIWFRNIIGWRSKDLTSDSSPPGQSDFPTAYHAHIMREDLGSDWVWGKVNKTDKSLPFRAAQGRVSGSQIHRLLPLSGPHSLWF